MQKLSWTKDRNGKFIISSKYMNLSQTDITYISIAIGYTIIIFAYNKYINYFDISENDSLVIVKTVFNVFMWL